MKLKEKVKLQIIVLGQFVFMSLGSTEIVYLHCFTWRTGLRKLTYIFSYILFSLMDADLT